MVRKIVRVFFLSLLFFVPFSPEAYSQLEYVLNDSEIWLGDDAAGLPKSWEADFRVIEDSQESAELLVEACHVHFGDQPVYLNDQLLGRLGLTYPYKSFVFSIPPGLLVKGMNTVKIIATSRPVAGYDDFALRRVVVSYEADHYWTNDNGGIWSNADNWNHDTTPSANDTTVFDLNSGYVVSSADATVESVSIYSGVVEFDGGTDLILGGAPSAISLYVDGSQFILSGGSVLVTDATIIASSRTAKIHVRNNGELDTVTLIVGSDAFGQLEVTSEGNVTCSILAVRSISSLGAVVSVTGTGSSLFCASANIGSGTGFTGDLFVGTGGYVYIPAISLNAGSVAVGPGGLLVVDEIKVHGGVLSAYGGGIVDGTVTNIGGTVSPGLSPGTFTINGDYIQEAEGTLVIEVGGYQQENDYDVLEVITGDVTLDGIVQIDFVNRFAPKKGDVFEFLKTDGTVIGSFSDVVIKGLEDGFEYDISIEGGVTKLIALNDGVSLNKFPWGMFFPAIIGDEK